MSKKTKKLTGMWWNVLNSTRDNDEGALLIADRVCSLIEEHNLDWVCLQEAYRFEKHGEKGDLIGLISKKTGWQSTFVKRSAYSDPKKRKAFGGAYEEGIATLSRWPIASQKVTKLGTRSKVLPSGLYYKTYLLDTTLDVAGREVTVGNTHWLWMAYKNARYRGAHMKAFLKRIQHVPEGSAYLVGGDFNTFSTHPIMRSLRKHLDLHTGNRSQPTWRLHGKEKHRLKANIDYIGPLKSGPIKLETYDVLAHGTSDHAPIVATFTVEDR